MASDSQGCPSKEELYAYVDAEADDRSLSAIANHVRHCERCSQFVEQVSGLLAALGGLCEVDGCPDIAARFGHDCARPPYPLAGRFGALVRSISAKRVSFAGLVAMVFVSFLVGFALSQRLSDDGKSAGRSLDALVSYLAEQPSEASDSDDFVLDLLRVHVEEEYRVSTGLAREMVGVSYVSGYSGEVK